MPLPCRIFRTTTSASSACVARSNHGGTGAASGTRHVVSHVGLVALNISSTAVFQLSREAQHWGKGVVIGWYWRSGELIGARVKGALSNVFQLCLHIYLGVMFKVENHKQLRNSAQHFSKSIWLGWGTLYFSRVGTDCSECEVDRYCPSMRADVTVLVRKPCKSQRQLISFSSTVLILFWLVISRQRNQQQSSAFYRVPAVCCVETVTLMATICTMTELVWKMPWLNSK